MTILADGLLLFSDAELACKATGEVRLASGFAEKLKILRLAFGRPMIVESCCRSLAYNQSLPGHIRSLHIWDHNPHGLDGCAAIDVRVPGQDRGPLVILAWERGWSVGHAKSFIHLDRRDFAELPQRMFGYG